MNSLDVLTLFLFNIVIYNIPLLYGTVGEIILKISVTLNLGVEGIMAVGAIFGYLIGCSANSLTVGILASFICAGLFGIIFAVLTVTMQANQNVTGLTMTTFGVGLFFFIGKGLSASWPVMTQYENINNGFKNPIEIPLLSKIPVLGKALFSHNILVYLGIFIAIAVWFYLNKTKAGLRLRAIGENPAAADSLGINITLYKYVHIVLGSGIMGIGGFYMGLNLGGSFEGSNCWINGYGWIAVALVIFANWNTLAAILGTLVFGFFNTLQIYSGSLAYAFPKALGFLDKIPSQLYQALPFMITALVLVFSSVRKNNKSAQPASLGLNYYREER